MTSPLITAPIFSNPVESGLSRRAVDTLASDAALSLSYAPGAPLEPIVNRMGGRLHIRNDASIFLRVRAKHDFDVSIFRHTGPVRDRFMIAEALGHYVLHYLYPKEIKHADPGPIEAPFYATGRLKWEAFWFASAFLMPAPLFRASCKEKSVHGVASEFGVAAESVERRASYLASIPPSSDVASPEVAGVDIDLQIEPAPAADELQGPSP